MESSTVPHRENFKDWFRELNMRADAYAEMRLGSEIESLKEFRETKGVLFASAMNCLKLYYLVSAPVVTIVARSNELMALARLLHNPARQIMRKILA